MINCLKLNQMIAVKKIVLVILTIIGIFGQTSHAGTHECLEGREAFRDSLYAMTRKNCLSCHDGAPEGGGKKKGPAFASEIIDGAYRTALKYASFDFPQDSEFALAVEERHWEKYDPTQKGVTVEELVSALRSWDEFGQTKCVDRELFRLDGKSVSLVPTRDSPKYEQNLRWSIDDPSLPKGLGFEMKITREMDLASTPPIMKPLLKISDLKLATPIEVIVGRVYVIVNGVPLANHLNIGGGQRIIFGQEYLWDQPHWPFARIQQRDLLIPVSSLDKTFQINLAYDEIKIVNNARPCPELDAFSSKTRPLLSGLCLNCHNGEARTGAMILSPSPLGVDDDCRAIRSYLWTKSLALSEVVEYPIGGKKDHPILSVPDQKKWKQSLDHWVRAIFP